MKINVYVQDPDGTWGKIASSTVKDDDSQADETESDDSCPRCKGEGEIELLSSVVECRLCEGSGCAD